MEEDMKEVAMAAGLAMVVVVESQLPLQTEAVQCAETGTSNT